MPLFMMPYVVHNSPQSSNRTYNLNKLVKNYKPIEYSNETKIKILMEQIIIDKHYKKNIIISEIIILINKLEINYDNELTYLIKFIINNDYLLKDYINIDKIDVNNEKCCYQYYKINYKYDNIINKIFKINKDKNKLDTFKHIKCKKNKRKNNYFVCKKHLKYMIGNNTKNNIENINNNIIQNYIKILFYNSSEEYINRIIQYIDIIINNILNKMMTHEKYITEYNMYLLKTLYLFKNY